MKYVSTILSAIILTIGIVVVLRAPKPDDGEQQITKQLNALESITAKQHYIDIVNTTGPREAIETLKTDSENNPDLARSCHDLSHNIGRAAYQKIGEFAQAIKFNDSFCNSGFMHGVIESHFSQVSNVEEEMKSVCSSYPEKKYLSWECYHGVGHGLMFYSNNDLPKILEICATNYESSDAQICANGAYMENFNTDQSLHKTNYVKNDDLFFPCNTDIQFKSDCYLYAPTRYLNLNPNKYIETLNWCNDAEKDFISVCKNGVGSQMMKENISNPKLVELICGGVDDCVNGMLGIYPMQFGSLQKLDELCPQLEKSNQKTCENYAKSMGYFFN